MSENLLSVLAVNPCGQSLQRRGVDIYQQFSQLVESLNLV